MKRESQIAMFAKLKKNLNTIEKFQVEKKGSLNDREQAIIAVKDQTGINIRKMGNTDGDILRQTRRLLKDIDSPNQPFNFAHGGKIFSVDLNEVRQTIAVTERVQKPDGTWIDGKEFFAQGEDAEQIAEDSGGWFTNTIVEHLDSAGAI